MIVLSALVQSRTGGVTSVYSSNHLDLSYRWCCNALSGFVANTRQTLALCPAPVAEELHTVTEGRLGLWVRFLTANGRKYSRMEDLG